MNVILEDAFSPGYITKVEGSQEISTILSYFNLILPRTFPSFLNVIIFEEFSNILTKPKLRKGSKEITDYGFSACKGISISHLTPSFSYYITILS